MDVEFFVVDESMLTEASMLIAAQEGPDTVIQSIVDNGGPWGYVRIDPEEFASIFRILDRITGTEDFLVDLAFAGSPHLVLTGKIGPWRLGYFEASLVQHLQPVFNLSAQSIEQEMRGLSENANELYTRLRQSLDDAFLRHFAVAIIHYH
jgi:hypothetical protein